MKKSAAFILCFLMIVLSAVSTAAAPAGAPENLYEQRVADPAAAEYYEQLMGLTPAAMAGYVFRETARVSAIAEGFPSPDTIADPSYAGRYVCCHEGFLFVQQCLWDQGFTHNIVTHEPGIFDLSYGIYCGRVKNEQADEVFFVYDSNDNQLLVTLTLAERIPQSLPLPLSVLGAWPELPEEASLVRCEYIYDPETEAAYADLFVRDLSEEAVLEYEGQVTDVNLEASLLLDDEGDLFVDGSTATYVFSIPMDDRLYLDEEGAAADAAALRRDAATRDDAPADEAPTVDWSCPEFTIQLYDEWQFDEEMSGDNYFRFVPAGDDRQGILIEILSTTLDEFSADYGDWVDGWIDGWATGYDVIFEGDAYWDAFPGALTLTFDIYDDDGIFAKMSIIAVEDNYADTYAMIYWEELEHESVPSYYDQALRIFESLSWPTG